MGGRGADGVAEGAAGGISVSIFRDAPHRGQKVMVSSTLLPHFGQYGISLTPLRKLVGISI
jgi:hypothetical protein